MEFTRKSEYAIAVLVALAESAQNGENERLTSARIAQEQQLPANLVPQIVAALAKKGWVSGTRGAGGGVQLLVNPMTITVREIVEMMEGPIAINPCLSGPGVCSKQTVCSLHRVWEQAQRAMLDVLDNTSVQDILEAKTENIS